MAKGKQVRIDQELDEAVEKIMRLGEFNTKTEASRKAGEILNTAFDGMLRDVGRGLNDSVDRADEGLDGDGFFTDTGVSHEMLGFGEEDKGESRSKF